MVSQGSEFRSRIRGPVRIVADVPPNVYFSGSRRYIWKTPEQEFLTDVYACADLHDSNDTYAFSRGYEQDSLFFLFVYDRRRCSRTLELRAFIAEDLVKLNQNTVSSFLKRLDTYYNKVIKSKHSSVPGWRGS